MTNGIRKLRRKRGMSLDDLAAELRIEKTELSKIERWPQPLEPSLVKDLAILFECGVADVLGHEIPVEEWHGTPYAAGGDVTANQEPYGNFGFEIAGVEFSFPVSTKMREGLLHQLRQRDVGEIAETKAWIVCDTLDNWNLFLNPKAVRRVWLRSDDDEATEYYAHPEVYRALDRWDYDQTRGPVLSAALAEHLKRIGEERAFEDVCRIRLFGFDGKETTDEYYASDSWVITSIFGLEAHSFRVAAHSLLMVASSGYHEEEYVSLSHVALMKVPSERFCRLSAPEETPSNADAQ